MDYINVDPAHENRFIDCFIQRTLSVEHRVNLWHSPPVTITETHNPTVSFIDKSKKTKNMKWIRGSVPVIVSKVVRSAPYIRIINK